MSQFHYFDTFERANKEKSRFQSMGILTFEIQKTKQGWAFWTQN
jgi:hypothetical protein